MIRKRVIKLARENDWGYTRILGELRKRGIKSVSRNTVKNILKENGLEPRPQRSAGTWDEFFKIHAATLWQCDFFSKKVLTFKGLRDLFVLVFRHVETRRVFVAPSTFHPNEEWVKQQARAFMEHVKETGLGSEIVMHDRDAKLTASFDDILKGGDLKVIKAAHRSPNTVAFVDLFDPSSWSSCTPLRLSLSVKTKHLECPSNRLHLNLVSEMVTYCHEERPHQAKDNDPLMPATYTTSSKKGKRKKDGSPPDVVPISHIKCRERLVGLLKHYDRKAA